MNQSSKDRIQAIGIMSGTSLDGMDVAACEFNIVNGSWNFKLHFAETVEYTNEWRLKLQNAHLLSGKKLTELHSEYGLLIGKMINRFILKTGFSPQLIASHGHTVFHQPEKKFTFQLGNGNDIASVTGITTVSDFRQADISKGGQGAPLVPVGDMLLFPDYDSCLNLGGFSNISYESEGKRIAFDICPVNIVLNYLSVKQGLRFDNKGNIGRKGTLNKEMAKELDLLEFYSKTPPKSLGREWFETEFLPILYSIPITETDRFRTVYEHIATQISGSLTRQKKVLVTGGGAWNSFLLELIQSKTPSKLIFPEPDIINFKEALVFAFLGVLRLRGEINCLSSVTGACSDSSSGAVFKS
jgi:anhydro-N-acetylmuramic acid kinase